MLYVFFILCSDLAHLVQKSLPFLNHSFCHSSFRSQNVTPRLSELGQALISSSALKTYVDLLGTQHKQSIASWIYGSTARTLSTLLRKPNNYLYCSGHDTTSSHAIRAGIGKFYYTWKTTCVNGKTQKLSLKCRNGVQGNVLYINVVLLDKKCWECRHHIARLFSFFYCYSQPVTSASLSIKYEASIGTCLSVVFLNFIVFQSARQHFVGWTTGKHSTSFVVNKWKLHWIRTEEFATFFASYNFWTFVK